MFGFCSLSFTLFFRIRLALFFRICFFLCF
jgi:hypothetical protein